MRQNSFFFITPKIVYDPKDEIDLIRECEMRKRPGDIPEFLERVDEAREKTASKFFKQSLKTFFTHVR
jgi:general secretion pathway protein D